MRTTLTIDPDVAIALERIRSRDQLTFKGVVNEAMRRGLRVMDTEAQRTTESPYSITPWDGGELRVGLDNVEEALAWAEGEEHR